MSELAVPVKAGLLKSLRILWLLTKIIVPISCAVVILDHFQLMEPVAATLTPLMSWAGLPGEAAIPLSLGFFVNFYAALGAISNMAWTPREITILGLMLGICHELPVETVICTHTGLKIPVSAILRISTAFFAGFLLNMLFVLLGG